MVCMTYKYTAACGLGVTVSHAKEGAELYSITQTSHYQQKDRVPSTESQDHTAPLVQVHSSSSPLTVISAPSAQPLVLLSLQFSPHTSGNCAPLLHVQWYVRYIAGLCVWVTISLRFLSPSCQLSFYVMIAMSVHIFLSLCARKSMVLRK